MHCTSLRNENPITLNCSAAASPTYAFGHRISNAWHDLLMSELNQKDLLELELP